MRTDGILDRVYAEGDRLKSSYAQAAAFANLLSHQNPHPKVLEISGGTGGITKYILETLGGHNGTLPRFSSYDFTDILPAFFEVAATRFTA